MNRNARYQPDPPRVVFEFAADGKAHIGRVSLDALTAMSGIVVTAEQAVATYEKHWRWIHAAALGLRAEGKDCPFVQRDDVE